MTHFDGGGFTKEISPGPDVRRTSVILYGLDIKVLTRDFFRSAFCNGYAPHYDCIHTTAYTVY